MQGRKDAVHSNRRLRDIWVVTLSTVFLLAMICRVSLVSGDATPQIIISPNVVNLDVGQAFTMTVNLTDFPNLFNYQIVLKYNGSILNLTSTALNSAGCVFNGHTAIIAPEPTDTEAIGDTSDNLNWTEVGASLLGDDSVAVTNGVLCEVNFTVIGTGTTNVMIATLHAPAHYITDAYYTFCLDSNLVETNAFDPTACTVLSGVANAAPVALFTVTGTPVNNVTDLILDQNVPVSVSRAGLSWVRTYEGLPTYFNASASYAPTGDITAYVWDFGDGNTTVVNVTSQASGLITHVYTKVTYYVVSLTVVASGSNGSHPMESPPASIAILVDLALPYYDWSWFVYTFFAIVVAVIVITASRSVIRRVRRQSALRKQKALTVGQKAQNQQVPIKV
jgi:hypothetical protein